MNLLLDTNVFIDYLGRKEPFFPAAQKIVIAALFGDVKLWIPSQSVVDAFYVLNHYVSNPQLQAAIVKSLEVITPLDLTGDLIIRAANLGWDDLEDCLIALAAEKVGADYLITRDSKGFSRSMVPVLTPTEWLTYMEKERRLVYDEVELMPEH